MRAWWGAGVQRGAPACAALGVRRIGSSLFDSNPAESERIRSGATAASRGAGDCGLVGGDQGVEFGDQGFQPGDGRAQRGGQHGVLSDVFGDGGDQQGDDRGESLAKGCGGCGRHVIYIA